MRKLNLVSSRTYELRACASCTHTEMRKFLTKTGVRALVVDRAPQQGSKRGTGYGFGRMGSNIGEERHAFAPGQAQISTRCSNDLESAEQADCQVGALHGLKLLREFQFSFGTRPDMRPTQPGVRRILRTLLDFCRPIQMGSVTRWNDHQNDAMYQGRTSEYSESQPSMVRSGAHLSNLKPRGIVIFLGV